jgi:hypothetical protein
MRVDLAVPEPVRLYPLTADMKKSVIRSKRSRNGLYTTGAKRCLMHLAVSEATIGSMTNGKVKRLTTMLCADAHGYSRFMGADEAGTLDMLRRYRSTIAGPVERHDGRIVNTWGDARDRRVSPALSRPCSVRLRFSRKFPSRSRTHLRRSRCGFASASI